MFSLFLISGSHPKSYALPCSAAKIFILFFLFKVIPENKNICYAVIREKQYSRFSFLTICRKEKFMFTKILEGHGEPSPHNPKEGDLFKVIQLHGNTFEIKYGFYEESDRHCRNAEPVAIYPDFIRQPRHTQDGFPFVTAMQLPCPHFEGQLDENSGCEDCAAYCHGEELLGICTCPHNRQ